MRKLQLIGIVFMSLIVFSSAEGADTPPFLPEYYSPVFNDLVFVKHATENNIEQFVYEAKDRSFALSVEDIKADRPSSKAILDNIIIYLNNNFQTKEGEFKVIANNKVYAVINEKQFERSVLAHAVPGAVQIWTYTYSYSPYEINAVGSRIDLIQSIANRHRYESALTAGNVSMGYWGADIYDYAVELLEAGKRDEGLAVIKNMLTASPFNYRAHLAFAENTGADEAAINSTKVVFQNAESLSLINKAASRLGVKAKTYESIPVLGKNETGLQVILIPLPPYNPWLLEESAKKYELITGVPVKIRRLKETWKLGVPDRIFRQRDAQSVLQKGENTPVDFSGWDKNRYIKELIKLADNEDPLSAYHIQEFVKAVEVEAGQYYVDPYLDWFIRMLDKYRSDDGRTMYVGITEANIYSGDVNYVFSLYQYLKKSGASILSYHMMLGKTLSEEFESRKRLTERIAKELVPASLKSLGIPRSTDPTCPYSYSNGVLRLDQKGLVLSEQVKDALEKLRGADK